MRESISKYGLNILSVLFATSIILTLWTRYVTPKPPIPHSLTPGQDISTSIIPGKWPKEETTLILFLSTKCHFCDASMPFYKTLALASEPKAHIIAVFPNDQSDAEARQHFASYGVPISDIRHVDFHRVGITGTPTEVVVARTTRITKAEVGSLTPEQQSDLFTALGLPTSTNASLLSQQPQTVPSTELAVLLKGQNTRVVDTRTRDKFAMGHIAGSVNMPLDEVDPRASHEIPKNAHLIVYCAYCGSCERVIRSEGNASACSMAIDLFKKHDIQSIIVVSDDLNRLRADGIPIEESSGIKLSQLTSR